MLKKALIVAHDLIMIALAAILALALRFDPALFDAKLAELLPWMPALIVLGGGIFAYFELYRGKWRFASMPDLISIAKAVGVFCLLLVLIDHASVTYWERPEFFFGRRFIILYWLVLCVLLGAPRLIYRYGKDRYRSADQRGAPVFALLLGRGEETEVIIRALEASRNGRITPLGILSPRRGDLGQSIRGIPVAGTLQALQETVRAYRTAGFSISRLIASPSVLDHEAEALSVQATRLGLTLSRLEEPGTVRPVLATIEIEDLLARDTVAIDTARLEHAVAGKRILVTGGGGSIGAEICARCLALGAEALCILDHAEPALHEIAERLSLMPGGTRIIDHLADIRDLPRLEALMAEFGPEIVFHAAALKHVPYLERDWQEGIKTNVFGSVNVARAAKRANVPIVVMISTDKAVEPVSILGATKRIAETAIATFDAEAADAGRSSRFVSVRFGNVLGSAGSVIPKFRAQIARGGPVTVTHPEMVRYFMTIREAASLVIAAAGHASGNGDTKERVSVYVLRMGQPVRILELAERMIRLSGYAPGRDIPIELTGIRPGERLNESLFSEKEALREIGVQGVMAALTPVVPRKTLDRALAGLSDAIEREDRAAADAALRILLPGYTGASPDQA